MDFREAAEDVKNRRNDRKEPTLEKTERALAELDRPDQDYRVVLVGGTNGKGSTSEMISQMLRSLGFDVGKFTSPHLSTLRERIEINGEMISEDDFLDLYAELRDMDLTFFEFMTVAAYRYFSKRDIDYAIMEVGMGGRLDATNAADNSTAVITNVGTDHSQYLGETREDIAGEKAGIIPEDGVLIDNTQMDVIRETAAKKDAERSETVEIRSNGKFSYRDQSFELPLKGDFQKQNLETAITAVSEIEELPQDLEKSLKNVNCPGRMEKISDDPETILDGAHNAEALEKTIKSYEDGFTCVFSAIESKDIEKMIEIIEKKASKIYVTCSDFRLAEDPGKINSKISIESEVVEDSLEALQKAQKSGRGQLAVTGSLYLIGDLKKQLEERDN